MGRQVNERMEKFCFLAGFAPYRHSLPPVHKVIN